MQAADSMFHRLDDFSSACRICGAVVASEKAHKSWHRALTKAGIR